ncbi:conserved unknown protein [Ectocarpus siliculosus]|uniref:Uncharacterized protein n=1 Tax=Ectocarpus siliculosus TaxID=2880 RepID=D7FK69_ECTSI|nr:conserved unknown protein [Ectocarpus siliculosus]|eukprot:CBJ34201.1 conserved unknown protein [Ectocarpus siliculosus]
MNRHQIRERRYLGSHHSTHRFPRASCLRRRPAECYPDDARLAKALEALAASHHQASFLVPVGAVRAVDCLRALSKGGKALVIAGDKGYVHDSELEGTRDPHLAVHGSFSCMVNFKLLHLMCEAEGGSVLHSQHLDGFKCSAMGYGLDPKPLPRTRLRVTPRSAGEIFPSANVKNCMSMACNGLHSRVVVSFPMRMLE